MKRALIINGDDLGYTHGVNQAMSQCARNGVLRSSTLMANGPAFEDAVAMVKRMGKPDVGVHLVLTELKPLCGPEEIPGLSSDEGKLLPTPAALAASLFRGGISRQALFNELDRQVSRVQDYGLSPTHLDSHKHVHVLPRVIEVVVEIALKHSIRWIRNPFDETAGWKVLPLVDGDQRIVFSRQHIQAKLLTVYRQNFLRHVRRAGLRTPDHFRGVSLTGVWNEAVMVHMVRQLPRGISEWMFHPGLCDQDLRRQKTRLLAQRENERDLLISPMLADLLRERHIILESFREDLA